MVDPLFALGDRCTETSSTNRPGYGSIPAQAPVDLIAVGPTKKVHHQCETRATQRARVADVLLRLS